MSRSGYSVDIDVLSLGQWRGQVASAIRGKRGQAFLKDLLTALDAMPEKRLIDRALEADGEVCAIGSLGRARGVDMSKLDPEDPETLASTFGIAHQLVREVEHENDEHFYVTPEERWRRMRAWVAQRIRKGDPP